MRKQSCFFTNMLGLISLKKVLYRSLLMLINYTHKKKFENLIFIKIHVMIFTVHALIAALEPDMTFGDIDSCSEDIFEVRIFGQIRKDFFSDL